MKASKLLLGSAIVALGALALSGCSGGSSSTGDGGKVEMTLWQNSTTGDGVKYWEEAISAFEKEHPNVTIKQQNIQNEDLDGKLQTALNAGDAPDIFLQRGGGKMADMVNAGQLMDLTGKFTGEAKDNISSGSFKAETYQDKVWAVPLAAQPGGIFYSKDLYDKAGVTTTPTTISELVAANAKLKASGVAPLALGAKAAWPAAHWFYWFALRECAPATMEKTGTSHSFDDPCWQKAAQDLQDFAKTTPFNDGFLTTDAQQGAGSSAGLVANHKAAGELMGAWDPGVIASLTPDQKPLADLSWYPFPALDTAGKGDPTSIMGGVDGYSCSKNAPKECVDFLNFIGGNAQQTAYAKAFTTLPVNSEAQKTVTEPYLKDILAAYSKAPYVSQWLDTVLGQNVGNALNVAVVDMLAGKSTPEQLVKSANAAGAKG